MPPTFFSSPVPAARVLAIAAAVLALIVLVGWATATPWLYGLGPQGVPMMPMAAACVLLLATGLWIDARRRDSDRPGVLALTILAAVLAGLSALQTPFGLSLGIDLWLFKAALLAHSSVMPAFPGRMSGATSLMIVLTSLVLATVGARTQATQRLFVASLTVGGAVVLVTAIGHWLGARAFATAGLYFVPAQHAIVAIGFILLGAALLRADLGWMRALSGPSAIARQARFLLAWIVVLPTLLAGLVARGVDAGWFDWRSALAIVLLGTIALLAVHVLWSTTDFMRAQRSALANEQALERTRTQLAMARVITGIVAWEWKPAGQNWTIDDPSDLLKLRDNATRGANPDPRELTYVQDRAIFQDALQTCINQGSAQWEFRVPHQDATVRWFLASAWSEATDAGVSVKGVFVDITDRRNILTDIENNERRLRLALDALRGFMYDWDAGTDKLRHSGRFEEVTGFAVAEAKESSGWWSERIHPDDLPKMQAALRATIESDAYDFDFEYRFVCKDGGIVWVWDHALLVRDTEGNVQHIVGYVLDITDRKSAAERNADYLQQLELAAQAAAIGMWTWDVQRNWLTWSPHCQNLLGMSDRDAIDGPPERFFRLLEIRYQRRAAKFLQLVLKRGEFRPVEFPYRRADGAIRWGQCRGVVLTDSTGRPQRVIGAFQDVTARRQMEAEREALLVAERAARRDLSVAAHQKDEFLAMVSHELRTPLNAIMGWLLLMRRPKVAAQTIDEGLRVLDRNAQALAKLLTDMFDANRLVSGKFNIELAPLDLNDTVREVLEALVTVAQTKSVALESVLHPEPLIVNGDASRLHQSVANVVQNAIKFTPAGGRVSVRTERSGSVTIVTVSDTGEGIEENFLPFVFEKFRQADAGSARRHTGMGLGLAIVKQLIEAHGGRVSARSGGAGQGTTISFTVPLLTASGLDVDMAESGTHAMLGNGSDSPARGLRILLVEDEPDARLYIARLLQEQGAEVTSAASANEALTMLQAAPAAHELLISDIGMPGASGYDLIRRVRVDFGIAPQTLPAIALTAFVREEDASNALAQGFQVHLPKPLDVNALLAAVRLLRSTNAPVRSSGFDLDVGT